MEKLQFEFRAVGIEVVFLTNQGEQVVRVVQGFPGRLGIFIF